jgi:hypothetical protein
MPHAAKQFQANALSLRLQREHLRWERHRVGRPRDLLQANDPRVPSPPASHRRPGAAEGEAGDAAWQGLASEGCEENQQLNALFIGQKIDRA